APALGSASYWVRAGSRVYGGTDRIKTGENAVTTSATAPLPASVLEALARYDTPTICNAMEIVAPERRLIGYTTKPLVCPFPGFPPLLGPDPTGWMPSARSNS